MKKIITVMIAAVLMAFATIPAFAASCPAAATASDNTNACENATCGEIESPVATNPCETKPCCRVAVPDTCSKSPKTGEQAGNNFDTLVFLMIGLAIAGCGVASAALVKAANKK